MPRHLQVSRATAVALLLVIGLAVLATAVMTAPHPASTGSPSPALGSLQIRSPAGSAASVSPSGDEGSASAPATASTGPTSTSTVRPSSSAVATRRVWWIVMENHEYGAIIGNRAAPYLNSLATTYGLATDYHATTHPSEPNYIALVAGSTLGVRSDGVYHLDGPSLFGQLRTAGRTWRVYAQNDPAGCFTGTSARGGQDGPGVAGTYVRKHNPAISFSSVADDPAQCRNIEPLGAFDPAAADFEVIVPNLTNDMHDGSIAQGDSFLQAFVPEIVDSPAFRDGGVLYVTFDEGSSDAGSLGDHGGHVATLIIATDVASGYRARAYFDHWSLLRTTEDSLGVPCLAGACSRSPIPH